MENIECATYEQCEEAAKYIKERILTTAKVAVVCGLSALAKNIDDPKVIPYRDIPNFPLPSTSTNGLAHLVYGKLAGTSVIFMEGRFHFYEGYSTKQCTMIIRVLKLLGIETLIITCSAAGINPEYQVGDFMLINDHIDLMGLLGTSPLIGKNEDRWGPRFLLTKSSYEKDILAKSKEILHEAHYEGAVREGVYVVTAGPTYKTHAEQHMYMTLGADAVGMSLVPEVLVATHCGMRVIAMALIINQAPRETTSVKELDGQEIAALEVERCADLRPFLEKLVLTCDKLPKKPSSERRGCHCLKNE